MLGDYNVENIAFWNETKIVCTVPIGVGSNMRVLVTHQDSRKSVYNNYWSYSCKCEFIFSSYYFSFHLLYLVVIISCTLNFVDFSFFFFSSIISIHP